MHTDLVGQRRVRFDGIGVDVLQEFKSTMTVGRLEHRDLGMITVKPNSGVSPLATDGIPSDDGQA